MATLKSETPEFTNQQSTVDASIAGSSLSSSDKFKLDVKEIIASSGLVSVTLKNQPAVCIPKDKWAKMTEQFESLIDRPLEGHVPKEQLVALNAELQRTRLLVNGFESAQDRFAVAEAILKKDLETATQALAVEKSKVALSSSKLESEMATIKSQLANAQKLAKESTILIKKASQENDTDEVTKLKAAKSAMTGEVTALNNALQVAKSAISSERSRVKALSDQILNLSNSLNLEKTKHQIAVGGKGNDFASVAARHGKENVDLLKSYYSMLSAKSKGLLVKANEADPEDVKNKLFWLKAVLNSSKGHALKPYQKIFGGLYDDICRFSHKTRLLFDKPISAMIAGLNPGGVVLTPQELETMLSDVPLSKIVLAKALQKPGQSTLLDWVDAGNDLDSIEPIPLEDGFVVNGEPSFELPKPDDKGKGPAVEPSDPIDPKDGELSLWLKIRNWFHLEFDSMNKRVRRSLHSRPKRLARYYKLSTGNFFQRICLSPYSWYLWAFP